MFSLNDTTGTLKAVWNVKERLRVLLRTGSVEDVAAAKKILEELVDAAARPETNRLYRTVCRWSQEIEALGATTGKVEAINTAIKNQANCPRLPQRRQLQISYSLEKCRPEGGMTPIPGIQFPADREEPDID